ncbi:hypothetical protein NDU88_007091 [Pleurodeles waltl]|uniref:Uncharacterized protein n=1 Tax=Pleurodeles waltl TaxID=8319 RepID=A0AAV7UMW2_PLEWA|nr:hypothetical protein NDU88_007091 [Pleurodeles waltl]
MWWNEVPYNDGEEARRIPRERPSKQQKRIQHCQYAEKPFELTKKNPGATGKVYTVAGDFRQSQRDDPSLKNAWQQALKHEDNRGSVCDGSDRFDPHTRATGAAAVGDYPEVTPRSQLPFGSFLHLRESGNLKGEVPEIGVWRSEEETVQETSGEELLKRVKTQRQGGTIGASRIPEVRGQAERRTSTVPTWDEDRRPWEAAP